MNERIRQLVKQAEQYALDKANESEEEDFEISFDDDFQEKFAELIVRDCVAICEDTDGEHIADARWGRRCCALEIREHFGVEE
jgi:hypothetical protein